jgi:metallo-beta-lactamase family protein
MSPSITHHGGAQGVTGSCHRLQFDADHAFLVDCGLFQGEEASGTSDLERHRIDFPIADVYALIVTHVHIDHIGRLPYLLAAGFQGPILCSKPSARLLPLVIEDALKVGFTRDEALIRRFLKQVDAQIVALDYQQWHLLLDTDRWRVQVRLQRAGHILGSAYVEIDSLNRTTQERQRIVFSGDLGAPYAPLLPAPRSPWKADVLVLESTYGDRCHENRKNRRERLRAMIDQALEDGGAVLIPAFSIGRTQELLYELEGLIHQANTPRWRELEVIVDSPLAARFTAIYQELKPWWDAEALRRVRAGRHPLNFENLYTVDSHEEHQSTVAYLTRTGRPAVVIAASGMASGGRIVNYLKAMLGDPRHQVLLVGYQAAGTPGSAIQKYGPRGGWVELDGQRYPIRAGVSTISGYSAHADQRDLLNFVKRMRHWPGEVRLVHGDPAARATLQQQLLDLAQERGHAMKVVLPSSVPSLAGSSTVG